MRSIVSTINQVSPLRILFAVDDSSHSLAATRLLARITWPAGTMIFIVAMVPDRLPLQERCSEVWSESNEALEIRRWRDWAATTMVTKEIASQLNTHGLVVETEICDGLPAEAILKRAAKLAVDLIVIGAQGFSSSGSKAWLSSTAQRLAYNANQSVLVVRPSMQVRPLNTIVAVDGSLKAWRAVEFLCSLSLPQWARVSVVNVDEKKPCSQTKADPATPQRSQMKQQLHAETDRNFIIRVVNHLHSFGAQAWPYRQVGDPAEEILALAQEQQADLIVVGVHQQEKTGDLPKQDVAQKVIKYAPCSVIVVRSEREKASASLGDVAKDTTQRSIQRSNIPRTVQVEIA